MSHNIVRPFIVKVSVLSYFPQFDTFLILFKKHTYIDIYNNNNNNNIY